MGCQASIYINCSAPVAGWQEIVYSALDDVTTVKDAIVSELLPLRTPFLASNCSIVAVRASHVGAPKKSRTSVLVNPQVGEVSITCQEPGDSVRYLGYSADSAHKRQFHMRGIPDTWLASGQLSSVGTPNLPKIAAWVGQFTTGNWRMLIPSSANTIKRVLTVIYDQTAGDTTFTTETVHSFAVGDLVRLTGFRSDNLYNGDWRVSVVPSTMSFRLRGANRYNPAYVPALEGTAQKITPDFVAMQDYAFDGVGYKKTGAPFGLQRGRRSAQVHHR